MCLMGSAPKAPDPPPLQPAPPAPKPPPAPAPAPEPLTDGTEQVGIKTKKSKRDSAGLTNQGTSSLRIPLNTGSSGSGGYNL